MKEACERWPSRDANGWIADPVPASAAVDRSYPLSAICSAAVGSGHLPRFPV